MSCIRKNLRIRGEIDDVNVIDKLIATLRSISPKIHITFGVNAFFEITGFSLRVNAIIAVMKYLFAHHITVTDISTWN